MKKMIVILAGLVLAGNYAMITMSQAANKPSRQFAVITGRIIDIDRQARMITVRIDATNEKRKFTVYVMPIGLLRVNEEVRIRYDAVSNIVEHIKVSGAAGR